MARYKYISKRWELFYLRTDTRLIIHRGDTWTMTLEWSWRRGFGLGVVTREDGRNITLRVAPVFGALYVSMTTPRWLRNRLPRHYFTTEQGERLYYNEDREIDFSVHGGRLWWSLWCHPMEWTADTPRWRSGNFSPTRFLFGKQTCETTAGETTEALVPMPEGCYAATITREDRVWARPRWPFTRRRTDYQIDIPDGIPFEGKGESSWDCGTDRLYGTGGDSPEAAIANAVRSVMERRRRYGTPAKTRAVVPRMAT